MIQVVVLLVKEVSERIGGIVDEENMDILMNLVNEEEEELAVEVLLGDYLDDDDDIDI